MGTDRPAPLPLYAPLDLAAVLAVANTLHGPEATRPRRSPDDLQARRVIDRLRRWPDSRRFLGALGLDVPSSAPAEADVRQLRDVREAVRALAAGDVGRFERRTRALLAAAAYRVEGGRLTPVAEGWPSLIDSLALTLLVLGGRRERLRLCRNAACGWVFLDASPNGQQIWCAAQRCGARIRARRHRSRLRAAGARV